MKQVTVQRDELRRIVEENRSRHRELFEVAVDGYRKRAVEILEDHIDNIMNGKVERVQVYLPAPEDHTKDYDRVIKMLDMEIENQIVLEAKDFEQYVMDRWVWKDEFLETVSTYTQE